MHLVYLIQCISPELHTHFSYIFFTDGISDLADVDEMQLLKYNSTYAQIITLI